jgi:DNA-binding Lrp family transcriptional regulator
VARPAKRPPRLDAPSAAVPVERNRRHALDEADRRLIDLLFLDGRTSNRALAAEVGLSEVTVAARLRSLMDRQILSVIASLDWKAAGYQWDGWLQIEVEGRSPRDVGDDFAQIEGVHIVNVTYGRADLLVHVLVPRQEDVLGLVDGTLGVILGVRRVTIATTLETVKFTTRLAAVRDQPAGLAFPAPVVSIDDIDQALIEALVHDGRQSNREVGRNLGVSESTVRVRLRRLENAGLLRISARVDPRRTGEVSSGAYVWVDTIGGAARQVAARLAEVPEMAIVALVAGEHDIIAGLGAATERDVQAVIERIRQMPGVRSTTTGTIVYSPWVNYQWARLLP